MFKKQLEKDIEQIFMNLEEFAEKIDLDGQEVHAIVEEMQIQADNEREVSFEGITVYVYSACLQYIYTPHKSCLVNGENWYVLESVNEQGITIIKLYRERV